MASRRRVPKVVRPGGYTEPTKHPGDVHPLFPLESTIRVILNADREMADRFLPKEDRKRVGRDFDGAISTAIELLNEMQMRRSLGTYTTLAD